MTSVGETLRRERLRHNLDLEAVSRELKISPRMLEAIEAEKFEKLPGGVFVKSFVRQYARMLGLDEEEMAGEVQRALGASPSDVPRFAESAKPDVANFPVPRLQQWQAVSDERRFSFSSPLQALALFVVVIMACSGVYAWWQHSRRPGAVQSATHAPAMQEPVKSAQAPPPAQVPPPQSATQTAAAPVEAPPQQQAPAAERQAPPAETPAGSTEASVAAAPKGQTPAAAAGQPGAPPPQTALPSNPNAPVRVQVTADEPVWVLARTDGKYLFSGTLDANQSRTLEANSNVVLRLGNAGGVTILLNGKPIGAVGPKGQVRTVELTSSGFQVVVPKTQPPIDPLIN